MRGVLWWSRYLLGGSSARPLQKEEVLMKRLVVLMTVVALLMVMLAMSVAPAFAHDRPCTGQGDLRGTYPFGTNGDKDEDGAVCFYENRGVYRDDHGVGGH